MSKESSTGASNSTRQTSQPLDDVPKLLTNDQESGFGGDMTNPSAIAGETETGVGGAGSGLDFLVPVPTSGSQTKIAYQNVMGHDAAIQGGEILTEDPEQNEMHHVDDDQNLVVVCLNDNITPVSEAADTNSSQALIVASGQQNLVDESQPQETDYDSIFRSVDTIRLENERKNAAMKKLENDLAECKLNESQLKEKVDELTKQIEKLRKEKENLEKELYRKEEETKKTKEQQKQHIKELVSKLQEMKAKVESGNKRLAEVEKKSEVEKKKLEDYIQALEKERNKLKSTVTKLQYDQKIKDVASRELIVNLKEKLCEKKDEEVERTKELSDLKVKYAQAETEITKERLNSEKNFSQVQIQQLQNKDDCSQAQIQRLLTRIESLEKEKSIKGATNEPKSSQMTPTLVDPPPSCIDHQTSETESSASLSSLIGTQNSYTESTGAPSRSTSRDIKQDTVSTETEANGDTQSGEVRFNLADDNDSTLELSKLQNTAQDKDTIAS